MSSNTCCGHRQATAILAAHFSASSREATSTTANPPMCSLLSGYGPSVIVPSVATTLGSWCSSPALYTHTPASIASCSTARAALATSGRSSRGKSMSPSSNRIMYCVISNRLLRVVVPSPLQQRTDLDLPVARLRPLGGELEGHVEVGGLDDPEAGEILLRFQEGPVGEHRLISATVDHGGRAWLCQAVGVDPVGLGAELVVERVDGRHLAGDDQFGPVSDH